MKYIKQIASLKAKWLNGETNQRLIVDNCFHNSLTFLFLQETNTQKKVQLPSKSRHSVTDMISH